MAGSLAIPIIWATFAAITAFYNIHLHPLAKFPGPQAACLSQKWLLAQSKTGKAEEVFERLHKEYGTQALRIGPNELHISDVSVYKTIYNQTSPYLKAPDFYGAFGTPHTLFVEDDPAMHKARRRMLNPFFSRGGILKIEPMIVAKIQRLLDRLETVRSAQSINIYNAIRCVTVDIISEFAFGRTQGLTQTSDANFYGGFLVTFDAVATVIWDQAYRPYLRKILGAIPKAITRRLSSEVAKILDLALESEQSLAAYRAALKERTADDSAHATIFDGLQELPSDQIVAEGVDILTAGSDTTALSVTMGLWHISHNAKVRDKLVGALVEAIPDPTSFPSLVKLEEISYLTACVRESIRVAMAVPGRLPRVVPDYKKTNSAPLIVDGMIIPPGTVVGMSAYSMHSSEELWGPDARSFNPDRWLGDGGKALDQHMVSFSKGLRSCIGQNLAYAEATLLLAHLLRRYDVRLSPQSGDPVRMDNFTNAIREPGVLIDLSKHDD